MTMIRWPRVKLSSVARTDVGRKRQMNEDSFFADDGQGFYVVADGVGGHNKGEIASREDVGDSRVYRVRKDAVLQLTEDHTLINYKVKHGMMTKEEAEKASGKNVITRAVGHKDYVQVDTADIDIAAGDRFLLCSDGLHG